MRLYQLIVSDGQHKGRYVGKNIFGARINPDLSKSPEIRISGNGHSLFVQLEAASHFSEWKALQLKRELNALGIQVTLEPIRVGRSGP